MGSQISMKLSDKQKEIIKSNLSSIKVPSCDSCGANKWIINDGIFELREFNGGNLIIGGKDTSIIPFITIICGNCGRMVLYNAIMVGILNQDGTPKK